ncbi:hypothetical protein KTC97_01625 [Clostridium estertheticum]|nr:hypothetical protein [Clostridium estertheticum]WLC84536.1 hypothetical protein KTC97_01625 [Clostridium estertheticum]
MKIVISSNGKTNENLLDKRFGRCEYFQIHDTESGEVKVSENKGKCTFISRLSYKHRMYSSRFYNYWFT